MQIHGIIQIRMLNDILYLHITQIKTITHNDLIVPPLITPIKNIEYRNKKHFKKVLI